MAYRPTVYKTGTVTLRLSQPFNSAWYLPSRLSKLKIQWHFLITAGPVRYSFTRLASSNFWREQQTATVVEFNMLWSFQLWNSFKICAVQHKFCLKSSFWDSNTFLSIHTNKNPGNFKTFYATFPWIKAEFTAGDTNTNVSIERNTGISSFFVWKKLLNRACPKQQQQPQWQLNGGSIHNIVLPSGRKKNQCCWRQWW